MLPKTERWEDWVGGGKEEQMTEGSGEARKERETLKYVPRPGLGKIGGMEGRTKT